MHKISWQNLAFKILILSCALASFTVSAEVNLLANGLKDWQEHEFAGKVAYSMPKKGVIKAISDNAASGLIYKKRIDLDKTPMLSWKWKITKPVKSQNEKTKAGDDFGARIYVVKANKLLFWKTISLNYVWSSKEPAGSYWDSPYTDNSKMIAMESSNSINQWQAAKVNLKQDFKRYFGKDVRFIDAIAIMSDTDNTKGTAEAYYSDLRLSR